MEANPTPVVTEAAQSKTVSNRFERMDVARGLGMLLVVLGHNEACKWGSAGFPVIFSFHVPLFFFLSGFFHKRHGSLSNDALTRVRKLLAPYFLTGLLLVLYYAMANPPFAKMLLIGVIWGAGGSGTPVSFLYWPPVWFLTSLFLTQVTFSILQPALAKISPPVRILGFSILLVLGVWYLNTLGRIYFPNTRILPNQSGLPWNLDLLPITLFYYWAGWECKKWNALERGLTHNNGITAQVLLLPLFAGYCILHASIADLGWLMDLNQRDYGHALMTTLGAFLGIMLVLTVSDRIANQARPEVRKLLAYIGMHSLVILIFHDFFQQRMAQAMDRLSTPTWLNHAGAWVAGCAAPLLLNHVLLRRIPWLSSVYGNRHPAKQ